MKKGIVLAIILISFILSTNKVAAEGKAQRYIGLHDKMLPIETISVVDGDTKVLFEDITKHLYITVTEENGVLTLSKHGKSISLTKPAELEARNRDNPLLFNESGKLLISLKYVTNQFDFKLEYFPEYLTLRIYRDNYPAYKPCGL